MPDIIGCTNPTAVNYNPAASIEDYSCLYLVKQDTHCYAFKDSNYEEVIDKSYTLSFSLDQKDWVFFHGYVPDFYFSGRNQLFNLKNTKIYKHNLGAPGVYHSPVPQSFFVDAVFSNDTEMVLNSLNWLTEVLSGRNEQEFSTLTHITIWNNQQCTGKISLSQVFQDLNYEVRKTQALWNFDSFRDAVKTYGVSFLKNLFNNFNVDTTNIDLNKAWFDQDLMHDNFFIIRFEFDNTTGNTIFLHGAGIDASKSYR